MGKMGPGLRGQAPQRRGVALKRRVEATGWQQAGGELARTARKPGQGKGRKDQVEPAEATDELATADKWPGRNKAGLVADANKRLEAAQASRPVGAWVKSAQDKPDALGGPSGGSGAPAGARRQARL